MERYSPGFTLMDMSDATVDSMQIETRGDSSPGILIAIAVMGGGWYNDIAIDTYGASADGAMAANGIFIHNSYPTIENFSINVHSPSNTAGVYVELSDYFPLFDDGTIRTYGFNCPGIYSVGSRPMFFHVNIAIEGWSSEDNWGPYPLPGPGCGLVSETQVGMSISEPYLNNCIIMMGNASPSAYASGGSPVHMTPANMKLYNCTCLDRVSGGPRWMGYSLDMDPGFPPGACILWAAHNRLKSPGGSGLGYPLFPAPDITMFSMAIMGAMDPQGNIPDFMF